MALQHATLPNIRRYKTKKLSFSGRAQQAFSQFLLMQSKLLQIVTTMKPRLRERLQMALVEVECATHSVVPCNLGNDSTKSWKIPTSRQSIRFGFFSSATSLLLQLHVVFDNVCNGCKRCNTCIRSKRERVVQYHIINP